MGNPTDLQSSQTEKKRERERERNSPARGSLQTSLHHKFCKCGAAKVPLDGAGTKGIYLFIVQGTLAAFKSNLKRSLSE